MEQPKGKSAWTTKPLSKDDKYDKEVIIDTIKSIRTAIIEGDDGKYIRLVEFFISSFPFKDKKFESAVKKLEGTLEDKLGETSDRYGKPMPEATGKAFLEFTQAKYEEFMDLLARKKKLPQEAEEEWL